MARIKFDKSKASSKIQELLGSSTKEEILENLALGSVGSALGSTGVKLSPGRAFFLYTTYFVILFSLFVIINIIPNQTIKQKIIENGVCTVKPNKLSWLSPSDISQGNYVIRIPKDKDIRKVIVDYDFMVDYAYINIEPDERTRGTITYSSSEKIAELKNKGVVYYARFPELQNRQAIRSFVLTALLALFLQECFKKIAMLMLAREKTIKTKKETKRTIPS